MGYARVGSNPTGVAFVCLFFTIYANTMSYKSQVSVLQTKWKNKIHKYALEFHGKKKS